MYKVFRKVMAVVAVVCCLCMNAGATGSEPIAIPYDDAKVESAAILRASGSFNVSVNP